jgi:hypothetical protein
MLVMRKAQLRPDVALLVAYAETLEAGWRENMGHET